MNSPLLLASASPRRQQLLRQLRVDFEVCAPDIDESHRAGESFFDYARRMAVEKATVAYAQRERQSRADGVVHQSPSQPLILAADTCGEVNGTLLTKPTDFADAKHLLRLLSGTTHIIYSAFALYDGQRLHAQVVTSEVSMRAISDAEIESYWNTGESVGKAGSYAIQGIGAQFVSHLSGSYSAVMGLPLFELSQALATYNVRLL